MLETVNAARDRLVVTWLADGGLRIGELCGLHLVDLYLRENAGCGECRTPHLHVCHRPGNPNWARPRPSTHDRTTTAAQPALAHVSSPGSVSPPQDPAPVWSGPNRHDCGSTRPTEPTARRQASCATAL
ncbi:hypothetical protein [Streptomyces sp. NPDC058683]|uniref:hypothetical protein n=1 Tax=Streptomyces sp. NPDC058683 TaxID=3346597 RepID=UPI003667FBCF